VLTSAMLLFVKVKPSQLKQKKALQSVRRVVKKMTVSLLETVRLEHHSRGTVSYFQYF